MSLHQVGYVDLPPHRGEGGFDHADVHAASDRLYVAHTSNDALDVIDCAENCFIESVPGLPAVAGALVSDARGLVFTSNRGENTVSVFTPGKEQDSIKIPVGVKPNGLAFDPGRGTLIAANVGDPAIAGSCTVSVVVLSEGSALWTSGCRGEPVGRFMIRRGKSSTSTLLRLQRSWRLQQPIPAPSPPRSMSQRQAPMGSTSIPKRDDFSARAMPACSLPSSPRQVKLSAKSN